MKKQDIKTIFIRLCNHLFTDDIKKLLLIIGGAFLCLLVVSVIFYFFNQDHKTRYVLFFPELKMGKLVPETRYIKKQKNHLSDIKALIEELSNGSFFPERARLIPQGTKIISLYKTGKHLNLNFSHHMLIPDDKVRYPFPRILQSLVNNILFNFKDVKEVIFYIDNELINSQVTGTNGEIKQIYLQKIDKSLLK